MSLTYFKKPFKDNHRIPYSILKLQTVTTNKRPRNVVGCLWGACGVPMFIHCRLLLQLRIFNLH